MDTETIRRGDLPVVQKRTLAAAQADAIGAAVRNYYRRYAASQVAQAIRAGEIARPETKPCAYCGGPALVYDHRDYHRPLDVVPSCDSCNHKAGPAVIDPVTVIDHIAGRARFPFRASAK